MEIYTGACRNRERLTGASMASSQGHVSQDEQGLQVMGRQSMLDALPEDILYTLYSYLPVEDAARAACVSHRFLRSWRRYPRLLFNNKTIGYDKLNMHLDEDSRALEDAQYKEDKIASHFVNKINHVLENHSGFGIKALILQLYPCPNIDTSYLGKWLQIAVKHGIEELALEMSILKKRAEYNFPSLFLSNEKGGATLESLRLTSCAFHPTTTLGCNRSLTSLYLSFVQITGEELRQFVSNCTALVRLSLYSCNDIICFKVPHMLHHLNHFHVRQCKMLQVIDIRAPNLSRFDCGNDPIQISLGAEVKHIRIIGSKPNPLFYVRTELPSFMPSVERLIVECGYERVKTPIMSSKFLLLKYLDISLVDLQIYYYRLDYFCLVSFLEASPVLETFMLRVGTGNLLRRDSVLRDLEKDQLHLRQMPECLHHNLKNVTIIGFTSAKSLIELTCHIVRNASVLACMTLDTARGCGKRTAKADKCERMSDRGLVEAQKALEAVKRCIEGMVPSSTNFEALEPCCQCRC